MTAELQFDDLILVLNHLSSFFLVIACWWLAHTYSSAGFPHGKLISVWFSLIGMTVLLTASARAFYIDPNPLIVITKCLLVAACITIGRRVTLNGRSAKAARIAGRP